ncbi:MFS sugar transporter [Purpureocillium lavendulum]|uniref:MFS sugar transporter n=1 Tax=Purpureocillium lavendulum TaxID=1247861 RepID=A0AB34G8G7_9HYPO|nr:MFS sugar transporter [Purpureocillium lavendulum]
MEDPSTLSHAQRGTSWYFKRCAILAAFDQSVVANAFALPQFTEYFDNPDANEQGNIVILFIVGGLVGAFLAGCFSDRLGRLTVIGTGVIIFTVGATLLVAAVNIPMLYVGRLISGIGCGAVANNTPLYLSEISPAHRRGRYTSLSNVMEDLGFALIAWVSFAFSYVAGQTSWRLIFACQYVGSVVLMGGVYVLPSSPRWLALKDRSEESLKVLAKLHADGDESDPLVRFEAAQIHDTVQEENAMATKSSWLELMRPGPNLRRFALALVLPGIQQFTGINAITYYAPAIFESAGIKDFHSQILLNAGNTTLGTIVSLTALYTLDKFGRRPVLLAGISAMTCLWVMIGLLLRYYPATATTAAVPHGFIVLFIWLFYSVYVASWGPCGWWIPMEVLPTNLRAKGAAVSVALTFMYNLCVSKTTPLLFVTIEYRTYFYYAGLCAFSTLITLFFLPETQGLTLEELDELFQTAPYIVWFGKYRVNTAAIIEKRVEYSKGEKTEVATHVETVEARQ